MSTLTSYTLDFEQPVVEIERQIEALRSRGDAAAYAREIGELESTRDRLLAKTYAALSAWQTVKVARHPHRPQSADYMRLMCRDLCELHGDRRFGDDQAIVTALARIGSTKVMLVGHRKGRSTPEKLACNFGCAHPEGYRKALHKMKLAEKFGLPIVTLVDTPGAYPGVGSEQRGVAEAIAVNLREMSRLRTPIVCVIIGEGGSGGALGIGIGDRVAMLEHSWYSVISPEGCAAILWKEANDQTNSIAAKALALTAADNLRNGLIDEVVSEPAGGAHRNPQAMADALGGWIVETLRELRRFKPETLVRRRFDKIRRIGSLSEGAHS
ncbi:MAG TPA: acetyl-CoA carboxylase carboxyltransferase subunit alpha [Phycisphaerales bacterium]|nr:acetyl-CoA carboxylase carboxyltransferase subunit alpha [Phycisphaerales bacterium]HMP37378.1 acetyl-CoA carboxylase carboxyltransferase subunit alpha [Phycisphaerales bacterium]